MNFFKKKTQATTVGAPQPSTVSAGLPKAGDALPASLQAHSQFIKRVSCSQCGAPKSLPSTTAYIYCDYCGALIDYDFRIANADTNAGLTNTVFHRLIAPEQASLEQAKARVRAAVTGARPGPTRPHGPSAPTPSAQPSHNGS